ncbi:MAG: hypothetical protein RL488_421 [Actinomycetota bacterium]|jgi:preprotein translocase subunit Sss1
MSTENFFDEDDLSRPVSEIPADIYDDGKKVITRQITPKTKAPVESQKGLSKRVLWTIVVIVVVGIVGIAIAVAAASTQTA